MAKLIFVLALFILFLLRNKSISVFTTSVSTFPLFPAIPQGIEIHLSEETLFPSPI